MLNLIAEYDHNTLEYIHGARTNATNTSPESNDKHSWSIQCFVGIDSWSSEKRTNLDGTTVLLWKNHLWKFYFEEASRLDADSLTAQIIDIFEIYKLNYKTYLICKLMSWCDESETIWDTTKG